MSFPTRQKPQIQTQPNTPEHCSSPRSDGADIAKHHIRNSTYYSSAMQEEESEYTLNLKQALKTAMDENETVSEPLN